MNLSCTLRSAYCFYEKFSQGSVGIDIFASFFHVMKKSACKSARPCQMQKTKIQWRTFDWGGSGLVSWNVISCLQSTHHNHCEFLSNKIPTIITVGFFKYFTKSRNTFSAAHLTAYAQPKVVSPVSDLAAKPIVKNRFVNSPTTPLISKSPTPSTHSPIDVPVNGRVMADWRGAPLLDSCRIIHKTHITFKALLKKIWENAG